MLISRRLKSLSVGPTHALRFLPLASQCLALQPSQLTGEGDAPWQHLWLCSSVQQCSAPAPQISNSSAFCASLAALALRATRGQCLFVCLFTFIYVHECFTYMDVYVHECFAYMYAFVHIHGMCTWCPPRSEEGIRSPRTGVSDAFKRNSLLPCRRGLLINMRTRE